MQATNGLPAPPSDPAKKPPPSEAAGAEKYVLPDSGNIERFNGADPLGPIDEGIDAGTDFFQILAEFFLPFSEFVYIFS